MNYCTRCGHPAGDASAFCISCGAPLATDEDQGWAAVPPGPTAGPGTGASGDRSPQQAAGVRILGDRPPQQGGNVRIFGNRPPEQTGNVRIIGGAGAGAEVPAGYGSPAFPGPGTPGAEPEAGREPGEDTAAWLPGFLPDAPQAASTQEQEQEQEQAPAPTLALPLRPPARPVRADPLPPRHPLVLPPAGDEVPPGDDDFYPPGAAVHQPPDPGGQVPAGLKIALVLVVIAAGLGAWYYLGRPQPRPSVPTGSASSAAGAQRTPRAQATQPSPGRPGRPPARSRPGGTPRGSEPVVLGPGVAGHSAAAGVAAFLTQYFAAINDHDYQAFSGLFEPGGSPVQSAAEFSSGYRTSRDSGGRLVALGQTAGGEWAASLTFDSQQDPASSATHTACTAWGVTFYLVPVGNSYLIGPPPPGYQASARPCA